MSSTDSIDDGRGSMLEWLQKWRDGKGTKKVSFNFEDLTKCCE